MATCALLEPRCLGKREGSWTGLSSCARVLKPALGQKQLGERRCCVKRASGLVIPRPGLIAAKRRGPRSEAGTAVGGAPQQAPGLRPWPRMPVDDVMSEEGESNAEPMVEDVSAEDAEPLDGALAPSTARQAAHHLP